MTLSSEAEANAAAEAMNGAEVDGRVIKVNIAKPLWMRPPKEVTEDEYAAPVVATMQAGLGRTAAFTPQIDGEFGIGEGDWEQAAQVLVTLGRWISGQEPPAQYYASVRREGREAVLSVEVDPELGEGEPLTTRMVDPAGRSVPVELIPVGENRFEARVPLATDGIYRFAAATEDGEIVPIDPVAVPYSPEFEARSERDAGERVLGTISRLSGGRMNVPTPEFWRGERGGSATRSWVSWLVLVGLGLLLLEITWRRLFEGSVRWNLTLPKLRRVRADGETRETTEAVEPPLLEVPAVKPQDASAEKAAAPAAKKKASSISSDLGVDAALKSLKKKRRR